MESLSYVLRLVLASVAIHYLLSTTKKINESNYRLPPRPPPLPVFGNLFSLGAKPHISFAQLAKRYGPLMMLKLGQVPTVVISSADIAKEALQKRDHSFANRYVFDAVCAFNYHENSVGWLPATSQWRTLRKICNTQVFSTSGLDASQSLRRSKVKDLISFVEKNSEGGIAVDIGQAAFTTTLNLLSNTFFSMDLGDSTSEFANELRNTVRLTFEDLGKPNIADFFPILQTIDPQGIRRRASVHLGKMLHLFKIIINQRLDGKGPQGMMQHNDVLDALLGASHEKNEELLEPSKIPLLLADLFIAGTDSTSTTLEWAMAKLLQSPEKFKKAQRKLFEIIGEGNLIEEHDISQLPYLQAVVKETLRLHPPSQFLLPRKTDTDVKLFDYTIPKNSLVLFNLWAMGRDPCLWDSPSRFKPERFLRSDIDFKGHDFGFIPFGAGRRICPGLPLASRMVPLMMGSLIHGFDWKLEDETSIEKMDMEEKLGITWKKAQRLRVIPFRV